MTHHEHEAFDTEAYLDEAQRPGNRGNWWEMPVLTLLVLICAWLLLSGWRGVGLAVLWIIAVAILLLERTRYWFLAIATMVIAVILTIIYIIVMFQAM
jgi:hypothetical protein